MASVPSAMPDSSMHVEWMWQSNPDPWSKSEPAEWSHYSDVENLMIEEAFSKNQPKAIFDHYYIDFKHKVQILSADASKQRSVKRTVCKREDKHLREERFMDSPITSQHSMGDEYGWISPFIVEVRRNLGLKKDQLASKDEDLVPMLVEKAALGIIEEGKHLERLYEAEKIADLLRKEKNKRFEEVWKCCVYLYSLESFLYKKLNEAMRLIGTKDCEHVWRSKVQTLGPFCLLLWDDPINNKLRTNTTLYRGANLKLEQIAIYEEMAKNPDKYRSFQAFTSCSRNREKAEKFGNTLFFVNVDMAFIADISSLSYYKDEEEELVAPGVCFHVQDVTVDFKTKKYAINLELTQRWSIKHKDEIQTKHQPDEDSDAYDHRLADLATRLDRRVDFLARRFDFRGVRDDADDDVAANAARFNRDAALDYDRDGNHLD